jgi:hypothetical protein
MRIEINNEEVIAGLIMAVISIAILGVAVYNIVALFHPALPKVNQ